jgi:hypothetical protein
MTDVTIPQDVAKAIAAFIRSNPIDVFVPREDSDRWANLLDPPPLSLREQALVAASKEWKETQAGADVVENVTLAVLALVPDWLAAQPLETDDAYAFSLQQRHHDVRLIRGETS